MSSAQMHRTTEPLDSFTVSGSLILTASAWQNRAGRSHSKSNRKKQINTNLTFVKASKKGNVVFTNVYYDNALLNTVWAKGQHLRGMNAHLTTSVYKPTAASKIKFMQYMNIHMNYLESRSVLIFSQKKNLFSCYYKQIKSMTDSTVRKEEINFHFSREFVCFLKLMKVNSMSWPQVQFECYLREQCSFCICNRL